MEKYLNSLYWKNESSAHPLFLSDAITASETKQKTNPQTLNPNPTFLTVFSLFPLLNIDDGLDRRTPPPPPPSTRYTPSPPPPRSTFVAAAVSPRENRFAIGTGDGDLSGEFPRLVFSCSGEDPWDRDLSEKCSGEFPGLVFSCPGEDP